MTTEKPASLLPATEIVSAARALYEALPLANFTSNTFEELGRAAYMGKNFGQLSPDLQKTLVRLSNEFLNMHLGRLSAAIDAVRAAHDAANAKASEPVTGELVETQVSDDEEDEDRAADEEEIVAAMNVEARTEAYTKSP